MALFESLRGFSALRFGPTSGLNLNGSNGDDSLVGSGEDDRLRGKSGDDTLEGLGGGDMLDGGNDDDVVRGASGEDTIRGGNGDDDLHGGADDDTIDGGNGADTITGGIGNDDIKGGNQNDEIDAGPGDNTVRGGNGEDTILAGDGADDIRGENNDDFIDAGDGDNDVRGGNGDDTILTGSGNDSIRGENNDDLIDAGDGDDTIDAGNGDDTITTGDGDDEVDGKNGTDTVIFAGSVADYAITVDGDDITVTDLVGAGGTDSLEDVEVLQFDDITFSPGDATDVIVASAPVTTDEDSATSFTIVAYDLDGGAVTFGGSAVTGAGVLTLTGTAPAAAPLGNAVAFTFGFDPAGAYEALGTNPGGIPSASEVAAITLLDENGGAVPVSVPLTIDGVNDAPVAVDDSAETDEDVAVTVDVQAGDTDVDAGDTLTTTGATNGANGTTSVNADGTVTYTPVLNFFGSDSFTYTIEDAAGAASSATVTVTVDPVNDAPVAVDDSAETDEGQAVVIDVQAGDSDVDPGDTLTTTGATDGAGGTTDVNPDGTVTYTPNPGFSGADSFTYTIQDAAGAPATATVEVTVIEVNAAPRAADDNALTNEDVAVDIDVLFNDFDPDPGDTLTVQSASDGANGTTEINADGTITYTPGMDFFGTDSFTYVIADALGETATATVDVTVMSVNDAPDATDIITSTTEDTELVVAILDGASDIDSPGVISVSAGNGANGITLLNDDGTVTYTPGADFFGTDSFTYTVRDISNATASATVFVDVTPVNDAPRPEFLEVTAREADGVFTIDLAGRAPDPENDPVTFSDVVPGRGEAAIPFSFDGGTLITVDPDIPGLGDGDTLITTLDYTASDDSGAPATGTVQITIEGVDPPPPPANTGPTANALSVVADEADGPVSIALSALISDPDVGDVLTITSLRTDFINGTDLGGATQSLPFSGGVLDGEGGTLRFASDIFGLEEVDDGSGTFVPETQTITLTYTVEDAEGLTANGTITLDLTGDTPGAPDNTPPEALGTPGAPGFPGVPVPGGFTNEVLPDEIIIDDPENPTLVIDLNTFISDAETATGDLVVTVGDILFGSDGVETAVPVGFDPLTNLLTIDLTTIPVADGASQLGTLTYGVSDGIDTTQANIVLNYVNPAPATGPQQIVLDFEPVSSEEGSGIVVTEVQGFGFDGSATVLETDELGGADGRTPSGLALGQTTPGGDNVLVGTFSTLTTVTPVLGQEGQPLRGEDGQPLVIEETEIDDIFALRGPGGSAGFGDPVGPSIGFGALGSTPPALPDTLPAGLGTAFDLNGLSVNAATGDGVEVTMTTYTVGVVEVPVVNQPNFVDFFPALLKADTFTFTVDASTPALELDFETALPAGTTDKLTDLDGIYAVSFETDDGSALVFDDIFVTV